MKLQKLGYKVCGKNHVGSMVPENADPFFFDFNFDINNLRSQEKKLWKEFRDLNKD